jgi:hypothetical protein
MDERYEELMRLQDGEYIEDEQEMSMEQFYAATHEILTQGGFTDMSQFDYKEMANICQSFLQNVDESGKCLFDLSKTNLNPEAQKVLYLMMQGQKMLSNSPKRSRRAKSERPF